MVRTKADCSGIKVPGAKATRKIVQSKPDTQGTSVNAGNFSGGNPYKPQPTPDWQKEITNFFTKGEESDDSGSSVTSKNDEIQNNAKEDTSGGPLDDRKNEKEKN